MEQAQEIKRHFSARIIGPAETVPSTTVMSRQQPHTNQNRWITCSILAACVWSGCGCAVRVPIPLRAGQKSLCAEATFSNFELRMHALVAAVLHTLLVRPLLEIGGPGRDASSWAFCSCIHPWLHLRRPIWHPACSPLLLSSLW